MGRYKTDDDFVREAAEKFRRKADEAFDTYQQTGIGRYDTIYHKYDALALALEADPVAARKEAAYWRGKMVVYASRADSIRTLPDNFRLLRQDELLREIITMARHEELIS